MRIHRHSALRTTTILAKLRLELRKINYNLKVEQKINKIYTIHHRRMCALLDAEDKKKELHEIAEEEEAFK